MVSAESDQERSAPSRRLVVARRIVLSSMGIFPLMCLVVPTLAVVSDTASGGSGLLWSVRTGGALAVGSGALTVASGVALASLVWRVIRSRFDPRVRSGRRDLVLSWALATALALLVPSLSGSLTVLVLWAASVSIALSRRQNVGALLYALAVSGVVGAVTGDAAQGRLGLSVVTLALYTVVWAVLAASAHSLRVLWDIITDAYAARDAQARLAVTEERLRFARDLHDLVGHSLSGIAVKSELAARLVERAPDVASAEMTSVRQLARDALRETRAAVTGYREIDLDEEIAGVRAVLTAAGVRCAVTRTEHSLPAAVRSVAAWVVREGGTNVLRHSEARRCELTLRRDGDGDVVVVEVHNDGVSAEAEANTGGHGIAGLAERVAAVGGSLTASRTGPGGFLLRAVMPVAGRAEPGASAPATPPPVGRDR